MKQQHIVTGAVLAAVLAASGWWYSGRSTPARAAPESAANDASALVKTEAVRKEALPLTVSAFGEVAAGKPETLNFAAAGQLVRLDVVLGQQVHQGRHIATLRTDPAVVSSYAQATDTLGFARRDLQRIEELLTLQLATKSQVDAARKQVQDAQAALAAQAKLGGARVDADLVAPFDGVVMALPAGQGDRLAAGAPVVQLGRIDRRRILLAIEPGQSDDVRVGMPVVITPVQGGATVATRITEMQSLIDPKSQMVTAVADIAVGTKVRLALGARVSAGIRLGQRQAWAVPRAAVLNDDKGSYLFQVANQVARRVDVTKLVETSQLYGVDGNLDARWPVVVLGNYELHDGMRVREGTR